ncbi:MAG TPA: GAF domain-containing protein [Clostridia bacterium]|nr:GAF domain-containing protein [Clostridia bacterium]
MEYNSILNTIEEQKKNEQLSAKLFRYSGLIQAIEFFSQKLNFEQIIDAAFDFVNELLTLEKSAVFVLEGSSFDLKKVKGYDSTVFSIENSENLQNIAVFYGALITEDEKLKMFFGQNVLESFNVSTAIPLIIENNLYGFIFISNKIIGDFNSDDYIIASALMKLFNNALENYKRYEELQSANMELDEKIFNLFAINQSSKALLSELSLDVLYNLSVDVFSELTQNTVTGFFQYDERSEQYILKAYKDIYYRLGEIDIRLTFNKMANVDVNKVILNFEDSSDTAYFNNIFNEGVEALAPLQAVYVVLLLKNGMVLGFVTLGKSVTGNEYKNSMFELIESLASATYTALSNAQLFEKVNEQKMVIQGKLNKLSSLNTLMRNINSSANIKTLLQMTLMTLEISFQVEKGLIAIYDKDKGVFKIAERLNIETRKKEIKVTPGWKRVFEGDAVYEASESGILQYISKSLVEDIGHSPGLLIAPIYIDRVDIEVLGAIILFKFKNVPITDEEIRLTVETIAGHIAPVLSNLYTVEQQKKFLLPNYIELFKSDFKREIAEALEFSIDLKVYQIIDNRSLIFKEDRITSKFQNTFKHVYPFSFNNIFIISSADSNAYKKIKKIIGSIDIEVREYVLGKDFNGFQDFFKLF